MRNRLYLYIVLLSLTSSPLAAKSAKDMALSHAHQHLVALAEQYAPSIMASRFQVEIKPPDKRLYLAPCNEDAIKITDPPQKPVGRVHIKVGCTAPKIWSLYLSGHIRYWVPVLVAQQEMRRGHTPQSSEVALIERDISKLPRGYLTDPAALDSQHLRRNISAGTVLTPALMEEQILIKRGDQVQIQSVAGNLLVKTAGEALSDGRLHQKIRVRNLRSKRIISGFVQGPGVIKAGP